MNLGLGIGLGSTVAIDYFILKKKQSKKIEKMQWNTKG